MSKDNKIQERRRFRWNHSGLCLICQKPVPAKDRWYCSDECRRLGLNRTCRGRETELTPHQAETILSFREREENALPWEKAYYRGRGAAYARNVRADSLIEHHHRRHCGSVRLATRGSTASATPKTPSPQDGTPSPKTPLQEPSDD